MKALIENLINLLKKKSPWELKKLMDKSKNPDNVKIRIDAKYGNISGEYSIEADTVILVLDEKGRQDEKCALPDSMTLRELFRLMDSGNIIIKDITATQKYY